MARRSGDELRRDRDPETEAERAEHDRIRNQAL